MSEPLTGSGWAIGNGFDILVHTIRSSQKAAERDWAREFANIGPNENTAMDAVLDTIWREYGKALGMRSFPISITEDTP